MLRPVSTSRQHRCAPQSHRARWPLSLLVTTAFKCATALATLRAEAAPAPPLLTDAARAARLPMQSQALDLVRCHGAYACPVVCLVLVLRRLLSRGWRSPEFEPPMTDA